MTGWLMLLVLAVLASALLLVAGFPRRLWTIPATALTLGAAGYAWQGSPALRGHQAASAERRGEVDPGMTELRDAMFGRFGFSYRYFGTADAMTRIGARDAAVKVMLSAVHEAPQSAAAWTGLGQALADHDGGMVSPSARFAFDRAMEVAPDHPGPPYFLGLAYVGSGQFAAARPFWARAAELAPADASYRETLESQLARLDRFLAERGAPAQPALPPAR